MPEVKENQEIQEKKVEKHSASVLINKSRKQHVSARRPSSFIFFFRKIKKTKICFLAIIFGRY